MAHLSAPKEGKKGKKVKAKIRIRRKGRRYSHASLRCTSYPRGTELAASPSSRLF